MADVLICGAGIAGIAAAYQLAVIHGRPGVVLVDERPPLSLTSDKSTECYRNFWPGPDGAMVALMNRSIDILEELSRESGDAFHLNRRGYAFATASPAQVEHYRQAGLRAEALGAGPLRLHAESSRQSAYQPAALSGFLDQPDGSDLILNPELIGRHFPTLSPRTIGVLHIRRAGWLSAQQLGMYMLRQAQQAGVTLIRDRVARVELQSGRVIGVELADGGRLAVRVFVNAAGPMLPSVAGLLGLSLPVYSELHLKLAFRDHLGVLPRHLPMLIWGDPQRLGWSPDERQSLGEDRDLSWLLEELPAGVHTRPDGGDESQIILALWEYNPPIMEPEFPPPLDSLYPEIVLRGLAAMLPDVQVYVDRLPRPTLDGGYYSKTAENRPLACPLPVEGAYVIGAMSGFGIMAAPALAELLALQITAQSLPGYAPAFSLNRYHDPQYQSLLKHWGDSWQL